MAAIRAYIDNIIYYNEENYYAVLGAVNEGSELTLVGYFPYISAGETVEAEGSYTVHPVYGEQFSASSFKIIEPEGSDAIERYLAGGAVKGIGPALAKRIVKKFKSDTFRIIEEEPERLSEVKGISETMAMAISEQTEAKKFMRDAVMFMQQYGIGANLANRIYEKYGPELYIILKNNPYRLAEDIDGIGFRTADSIAQKAGVKPDDPFRIRCGLLYVLSEGAKNGHTWLPEEKLKKLGEDILKADLKDIEPTLIELQISGKIVIIESAGIRQIYLSAYYYTEKDIAARLLNIAVKGRQNRDDTEKRLLKIEKETGIELDELQKQAVYESNENGLVIITGGPGTGKTTTINILIKFYTEDHQNVMLAAPTGRAAKRMTEATGAEAKTIHRLLEYTGVPTEGNAPGTLSSPEGTDKGIGAAPYAGSGNAFGAGSTSGKGRFLRDEKDPLEADVLIIDEMSMVDIFLMEALLKAVVPGTRLILVGDANQLPSVGAGNVLKDIINTGIFKTVKLDRIFRQAAKSDIVINAHKINAGLMVELSKKSSDFMFIKNREPGEAVDSIIKLITDKLPGYVNCSPLDIQVLTATKKGMLGVENLNVRLQACLNPKKGPAEEKELSEYSIRVGDKVMQTKNDYDLEWVIYDKDGNPMEFGTGMFNGDIGRVLDIDTDSGIVTVIFDDMKHVKYDGKQLANLELAYAVTVHKSQGSEYPAVIMPMFRGPHLLMNKNVLYTAVTRAKKCVVMVGLPEVFWEMEQNENENSRYSGLSDRITELKNMEENSWSLD